MALVLPGSAPAPERAALTRNVAELLAVRASELGERPAVLAARGRGRALRLASLSFAEIESRANRFAAALRARGLAPGDRACVFVPPGAELVALAYALWKCGAVPVLMDPGLGLARLARAIEHVRPRAFVGIPAAHALRLLAPSAFRSVGLALALGARGAWLGHDLARLARRASDAPILEEREPQAHAAVLFTSGATGPPKGVVHTHESFRAQLALLGALYGFGPGQTDLACFPLFALFSPALGMSAAFPELDTRRPGRCDPELVVDALRASGATSSFGSPAIWKRVAPWCHARGRRLAGLRTLLVAGAPVPLALFEQLLPLLDDAADLHSPYGATEALPVSSIGGRELLSRLRERSLQGEGTCVGAPAPGVELRVLPISDEPIQSFDGLEELPSGAVGELCVAGANVSREYLFDERATQAAKIREGERVWHRMGDLGRRDAQGLIWFGGRKSHRIESARGLLLPVPVENLLDRRPEVGRSALVGVGARGAQRAVLVVEPRSPRAARGRAARARLRRELLAACASRPVSAVVEEVLLHPSLPVDIRHNAKIDRTALARWAERELA